LKKVWLPGLIWRETLLADVKHGFVVCRSALSVSRLPGLDYSINPYVGCEHGCVYCYSRSFLRDRKLAERWGSFVWAKRNLLERLRVELPRKRRGVVGVGVLTDPYQPFERKMKLTRGCLEILASYGFPVSLQTKSALILRDVDLIKPENFDVGVTITTLDRGLAGSLEPKASPPEARVQVVEEYSSRKVETWIFLGPIIPGVNDRRENFEQIVRVAEKTGSLLLYDKLNLRREIRRPLGEFFRREKPELLEDLPRILQPPFSYWRRISETIEKLCRERNVKCQAAFGHFPR